MMYRTCPHCGAALDPGERCDCRERTPNEPRENSHPQPRENIKRPPRCYQHRDGQKQNHNHMIPPSFYRAEEGEVKYENGRY